jgi:hypothetical protein
MKTVSTLILSLFWLIAHATPPAGYNLVFQSAFTTNGFVPVASNWNSIPNYVYGNLGRLQFLGHTPYAGDFGSAYFTTPNDSSSQPSPFWQRSGNLIIKCYIDSTGHWRSGLLSTVGTTGEGFSQALGYWETSFKVPAGGGTWPSFWLLGMESIQRSARTVNEAEIDIIEGYGYNPFADNQHVHVWAPNNGGQVAGSDNIYQIPSGMTETHIYGCLINVDYIHFYVDGVQVWQTSTPPEATHPMYAMLDLALGAGYLISLPSGSEMWISYIRCYAPPL